eukprot:10535964-Karenia_brevis.AAC.1
MLSLQSDVREPWLAKFPGEGSANVWLYCRDCKQRWFPEGRCQSHVPFRDKASQAFLKPVRRSGKPVLREPAAPAWTPERKVEPVEDDTTSEHGMIATDEALPDYIPQLDDDFGNVQVPDLPGSPNQRPTLEEYEKMWDEQFAWHARTTSGEYSRENLCPTPVPQLWQDVPHVPFDELKSAEAQSRLSVCRPHSSLEPASCADGVP